MPTVQIPPPYRGPTGGVDRVPVEGRTVLACLQAVDAHYPGFGAQVFDGDGKLHRFVKLFLNGEPVPPTALASAVKERDEISIIAAIAGG